jgi:hypothetical protein
LWEIAEDMRNMDMREEKFAPAPICAFSATEDVQCNRIGASLQRNELDNDGRDIDCDWAIWARRLGSGKSTKIRGDGDTGIWNEHGGHRPTNARSISRNFGERIPTSGTGKALIPGGEDGEICENDDTSVEKNEFA